jgi:hypothetical protein
MAAKRRIRTNALPDEPGQTPITLTRVEPPLPYLRPDHRGLKWEVAVGVGVVAFLLLVLSGIGWFLVARSGEPAKGAPRIAGAVDDPGLALQAPAGDPAGPRQARESVIRVLPIPDEPVGQEPAQEQARPIRLPDHPLGGLTPPAVKEMPQAPPKQAPAFEPMPVVGPPQPPAKVTVFMGLKALGRRICIIADSSGSMQFNNRMGRLKKELTSTLLSLGSDQEFYVIYFSSGAMPMPAKTWRRGGRDAKRILPWVNAQPADGATEPLTAFTRAFRLKPRPDAIFFLTDGIIPKNVPDAVARRNAKEPVKIPIHTILFGGELAETRPAGVERVPVRIGRRVTMVTRPRMVRVTEKDEGQLERISRESGGSHRFVPDVGGER